MKKFQPTSKCSLILCACIAVAFSPLAEADSAARDHAPPSSLRRQEGSKSLYWNRSRLFDGDYEDQDWNDDDDDLRPYWENPISIANLNNDFELFDKSRLKIKPENYVDDGKMYVEFNCEASLKENDKLTWYMVINYKEYSGVSRLQLMSRYVERSEQAENKTLKLTYPLTSHQRNGIIYCMKSHKEADGKTYYTISNNITLDFQTEKDYLHNSLHFVRPKRTTFGVFYYNDTVPLMIDCFSMTRPKLQRNYYVAWYQIQGNEKKLLTKATFLGIHPWDQNYVRLELSKLWKPSDDGTKILCAQEYWFTNKTTLTKHTAQESELFTLKYHLDECSPWLPWMSAAVAMLVVFLAEGAAVALAIIICLRPKTPKTSNPAN